MDKTTTVNVSGLGEFTIKNELTIGEELQIDVRRATLSNGMYGQMIESPNIVEMTAGWRLFRLAELDFRIGDRPPDFKGCSELSKDQFDALWKEWTEKSGKFLQQSNEPDPTTGTGGESKD